jgi:hypothetical protein
VGYVPEPNYHVYFGVHYLTHSIPPLPGFALQWGGEVFFPWREMKLSPFLALDTKWNHESPVALSVSAQVGIALNNPPEAYRSFRFFYSYYSGEDPRGQFYLSIYTAHMLGIEMQI